MHSDGGTDGAAVGLNLVSQNLPEKKELSRSKQERGPEGTVHTGVFAAESNECVQASLCDMAASPSTVSGRRLTSTNNRLGSSTRSLVEGTSVDSTQALGEL